MDSKKMSSVQIKNADEGRVEAVFSTFGVIDHDGDMTEPSAFEHGSKVLISAYNHKSWEGALPAGKGTIEVTASGARLKGQFFMNTQHGRDTFETVKALAADGLGDWSYGFEVKESDREDHEGKSVRVLKKLKVFEVSPVIKGAGIGTQTLAVKADPKKKPKDEDDDEKNPKKKPPYGDDEEEEEEEEDDDKKPKKKPVKRDFSAEERRRLADSGKAMPDGSFPIVNREDLTNAIRLAGKASNPGKARAHIRRRARALGAESAIPDDWKMLYETPSLKEEIDWVVDAAHSVIESTERVVALRAKHDDQLSNVNRDSLVGLREVLSKLDEVLAANTETKEDATAEYLRYVALNLEDYND
jgi:phage head maturation protease